MQIVLATKPWKGTDMRIDTALNKQAVAVRSTRSLYSSAYHSGMTHTDILAGKRGIAKQLGNCPEWVRQYVRGYDTALFDRLYEASPMGGSALVHGGWIDGRFYSVHRDRPDYYEKNGFDPAEFSDDGRVTERGHYWGHFDPPRPF